MAYIASYGDLIGALGTDGSAGTNHFINHGYSENRSVTFDASAYLANYADLRTAFGTDQELAKKHFIKFGFEEGRIF